MDGTCAIEGCDRPRKTRGMCHAHYMRWWNGDRGDRLSRPLPKRNPRRQCSVPDCALLTHVGELCSRHYMRLNKTGDVGPAGLINRPARPCKVDGCRNLSVTRTDLCPTHRRRKRLYGTADGTFATHMRCIADGCAEQARPSIRRSDLCTVHHLDWVRSEVAGGRMVGRCSPNGYRYSSVFKKKLADHRLAMEHKLGRELYRVESVHHKNGVRDDNRPENLELWVTWPGQRPADLVEFVVEHYREAVLAALAGDRQLRMLGS